MAQAANRLAAPAPVLPVGLMVQLPPAASCQSVTAVALHFKSVCEVSDMAPVPAVHALQPCCPLSPGALGWVT